MGMGKLKRGMFLWIALSASSDAALHTKVTIDNNLTNCIRIANTNIIYSGDIPFLDISHEQIKTLSACGCKSAITEYKSYLLMDGYDSQLLVAKFSFGSNYSQIPIASHKKMIGDYGVLVSFNCSIPD